MWKISKKKKEEIKLNEINKNEQEYLYKIGKKTWKYFKDTITQENNYLPPDNMQEDRKPLFVNRTSSTNIGLALLCVISSYDMKYESLEDTLNILNKMLETIQRLPKWNGHLYNWYNIQTLEPLQPKYISSVDSGNFVGYIYVLKSFYAQAKEKIENDSNLSYEEKEKLLKLIPNWTGKQIQEVELANADFKKLYVSEKNIFSIGYNIEENKLTPSYYDLLASEARQTSFIAISKKDVPLKHWYSLSRTLTEMNGYSGLLSWAGTAFEYLMPNVIMKNEEGNLIDESCNFMLMEQKIYAKKLGIPWGFSETAFYLKDLNNNYQYKAIGLPWLGLKRGLEDDIVVASYASGMALNRSPKEVVQNLKKLDELGMNQKYGFYESIDFTPARMVKAKKQMIVKTYMAHHQALILLSINNLFNNNILQKRFSLNPEIKAVEILLQETMPEKRITTKEEKIKPEKIVYKDYETYCKRVYKRADAQFPISNVISSENYSVVMKVDGSGYSQYKNNVINKNEGIFFYLKNIKDNEVWIANKAKDMEKYEISFTEDSDKIKKEANFILSKTDVFISPEKPVEIRKLELQNNSNKQQTLEITTSIEPALAPEIQIASHPAFQNLFLTFEYLENENIFVIKRKNRENTNNGLYLAVSFTNVENCVGDLEYEIDNERFQGRGNYNVPELVKDSKPFSKKIQFVLDPILALRRTITIKPEEKVELNLLISANENKEEAIQNVKEYMQEEKIKKSIELSIAKAETEARYLRLKSKQIETYQKLLSYLLFENSIQKKSNYNKQFYEKEKLWKYGISGDIPILLVEMQNSNESEVLDDVIKAYEFFRLKNIEIDLVVLDEEPNSYEKYTKESIQNSISNANLEYMQNIRGGIFVIDSEEKELLEFYAKVIIDTRKGPIQRQLEDLEEEYSDELKNIGYKFIKLPENEIKNIKPEVTEELLYENEYGGFSQDGKEYLIVQNRQNRLPTVWSNIIANKEFGTLVTDSLGGFTYNKNSGLNKITDWSNNQVTDEPSEVIYIQEESGKTWSVGLSPRPDENDYKTKFGFGYSEYEHTSNHVEQKLTVFVAKEDPIKISILSLKNSEPKKKKLNIYYYLKLVLGENLINTNRYVDLQYQSSNNIILFHNKTNTDFKEVDFVSSNEKIKSYTGDKKFFFGKGNISRPDALRKISLDNQNSIGKEPIVAMEFEIELESYEEKQIILVLGSAESNLDAQDKAYKYTKIDNAKTELEQVKKYWTVMLDKVQVFTPLTSFNILMNGWLIYQTLSCRLYARSAFYQCGGAYGFRDQLQDMISLKYFDSNIMKQQIIKHSKHQFIEGDVEHWWHDETKRGIRTNFSDDLLWLAYITEEYINFTGDYQILNVETPYVTGNALENGVNERYDVHEQSSTKESIFIHCERAIKKSLKFGKNGLPLIGSGDWNDGLSRVGINKKGESVWLGFFLYDILNKWIPINEKHENEAILSKEEIQEVIDRLKKSLNENGWDGRWYRRAFMDDGQILGTLQNEECKIDGIAQSWSVISKAGESEKKKIAMQSLENHLVDKENGLIKLLDPPFEKSKLEPGYIKAYLPGTRENGGQYTHECCSCGHFYIVEIFDCKEKNFVRDKYANITNSKIFDL